MRSEIVDLVELVSLTQAVPGSEICIVDVYSCPVAFDRSVSVLHLEVLVAHEGPRGQVLLVEADRSLEVNHGFVVVASQRVVVANCAASLRSVLVVIEDVVSEVRQLAEILFNVQDVGVEVEVLISVRVSLEQVLEPVDGHIVLLSLIASMGHLIPDVDRIGEVAQKGRIERD